MLYYLQTIFNNNEFKILIIAIVLDTILGILRAIRQKKINSTIGIDGIIRKVAMIFSILFLSLVDTIIDIDLLSFIPESIKQIMNLQKVGIGNLFGILFIVFEFLSVLKNMVQVKLPIPKKLQNIFEKLMKDLTDEIKEERK